MKKRAVIFATTVMLLAGACGGTRDEGMDSGLWGTQMEGLRWGMSAEQIGELYPCTEGERTDRVRYLILEEPVQLCGVPMEVELKMDDALGLIRVTGFTDLAAEENYEKLEKALEGERADYRTGAQPTDGVSYKSETAGDRYSRQELQRACDQMMGEGVIGESYLTGAMNSPLVFYELRKARGGCMLTMDATVEQEMEYIFSDSPQDQETVKNVRYLSKDVRQKREVRNAAACCGG